VVPNTELVRQTVLLGLLSLIAACRPIRIVAPSHDLVCGTPAATHQYAVGAFLGGAARDEPSMRRAFASYQSAVGRAPAIVKVFRALDEPFDGDIRAIVESGATPMITVEPTWRGNPRDVIRRMARGEADSMLRARASELRLIARDSVIVEFAPEMNARFGAPLETAEDSNTAVEYRAAWQRTVRVMRDAGLTNARWLWSPSAGNPYTNRATGETHWNWMDRYYPGDDFVDYVGLHAFNDAVSRRAWVPFVELVDGEAADRSLTMLHAMHPSKPIVLGEIASSELPGKPGAKGAWITTAFDALSRCAPIAAVIWFDSNKEQDWRINSSAPSLAAFRAAVLRWAR